MAKVPNVWNEVPLEQRLDISITRARQSATKLREKQLHPLLDALGIPRGGFHSMRHGAASSLLAAGATPAVVQAQLRHSDPRITLGIYGHVIGDDQRNAVQNRCTKLVN
jgi:integrase